MRKRYGVFPGCISGIMSLALAFSSVMSLPVYAEDVLLEEDLASDGEAVPEEPAAAVFVITEFKDFTKGDDGKFKNEETQQKYGELKAAPGTAKDQLGLPKELDLTGYWEADGADAVTTFELRDFEWKLKSDFDEVYTEASPEGDYAFQPDLDAYAASHDGIDEFRLAESVKLLKIGVTIAAEQTETEPAPVDEPTDPYDDGSDSVPDAVTDDTAEPYNGGGDPASDDTTDDIFAGLDDSAITIDGSDPAPENPADDPMDSYDDGTVLTPDAAADDATDPYNDGTVPTPDTATDDVSDPYNDGTVQLPDDTNGDIFSGLDDSAINANGESTYGIENTGEATDGIENDGETIDGIGEDGTIQPLFDDGTGSEEPAAEEEAPPAGAADPAPFSAMMTGKLEVRQYGDGTSADTVLYTYTDENNSTTSLTLDELQTVSLPGITLACGVTADLTKLEVWFTPNNDDGTPGTAAISATLNGTSAPLDLSDGTAKELTFATADEQAASFKLSLAIQQATHTPGAAATCTTPQTCTVCGAELAPVSAHTPGAAATCTTPQTCTVCGAELAPVTAHTPGAAATCTTPQTCTVCGAELAPVSAHTPGAAATCLNPQVCTVCGTVIAPAAGHTPGAEPTCTTPQTCTVCGDVITPALGHAWKEATCTTPKTCTRCNATEGTALGHDLHDDWETVSESSYTKHGKQERYCHRANCDYTETRDLNIVGLPTDNAIWNLEEGAQYNLNTRLTFQAYGAGMENSKPIKGDVRYVPSSWTIQNTPGSFLDNFTGAFSISKAGTYTLTVTFQKQIYEGSWKNTNIADSKSVTFTVGTLIQGTPVGSADAVRINPQTGDSTPIVPLAIALVAAAALMIGMIFYKKKRK